MIPLLSDFSYYCNLSSGSMIRSIEVSRQAADRSHVCLLKGDFEAGKSEKQKENLSFNPSFDRCADW